MRSGREHFLLGNIFMGFLEHDFWVVWSWGW
jgi:hypothetical protein